MKFSHRTTLGVLHHADNLTVIAGHKRLLGWYFYTYHRTGELWALHRVWNFKLFALHHVGEGKSVDAPGWHITFAKLRLTRGFRQIALTWAWANTFRTKDH